MFKVISHDDVDQWNKIIRNSKNTDIYQDWAYVNSFKLNGDGEPLLFTFINEDTEIINVVFKRNILNESVFKDLEKNNYYDIISPYGYGGVLIQTNNESDVKLYFQSLQEYCIKNNIVSEFVRYHPLINNYSLLKDYYDIIPLGETIAMELKDENIIWSNLQTTLRSKIRQTNRSGVEVYFSNDKELMSKFIEIYEETMKKNKADNYYFFNTEYYQSLINDLKHDLFFCYARYNNEIIAMSIMLLGNNIIHYHLSGTKSGYESVGANNVMLLYTALWGERNGYSYLHLGGGVGSKNDSLLSYKKKFNKNSNLRFHIGKKIFDHEKYNELVKYRKLENSEIQFFPKYRFVE